MKTVIIYDQCGCEDIGFIVKEGDWSKFNNVYINDADNPLSEELAEVLYGDNGEEKFTLLEDFPYTEVVRDEAVVIVAGFLP